MKPPPPLSIYPPAFPWTAQHPVGEDDILFQVGIVSMGGAPTGNAAAFTDVTQYMDWINEVLGTASTSSTTST